MRFCFVVWLVAIFVSRGQSQIITVTDYETGKPIGLVTLKSESPHVITFTDENGQADLSAFKGSEKIIITQLQYKSAEYSFEQLEALNFNVQLIPKLQSLQEVSVSAQRWEHKKIESPSRITSIDMREASFQNPQTTADLLGISGYAFIQKSQLGGGSPMLRGMAANRVLLVVDGVRMNNAIFRSGNLQNVISLDANAIESAEILFGPGSVMFGSDAIGGVMSFNTLLPKFATSDDDNKKVFTAGNAMMRFSSANSEKTGHINFNLGFKKLASVTTFTYADYGDLRSGSVGGHPYFYRRNYVITYNNKDHMIPNADSTLQIGSEYSQINFMQKIRYKPNKYWDMDYGFHFSETSKFNRYDRLYVMREDGPYKGKLRWAEWYYGPQKWQMHRFGSTYSKSNLVFDKIRLIIANQFFEESRYDREFMYRELRMQKENVFANSINLDLDKKLTEKITINYGYEFVHNKVHSVATLTHVVTKEVDSTVTRYPDGSIWKSNGGYLTLKYKVLKKWLLNGGLRYNRFYISANFDTTFFPFPFTSAVMRTGSLSGSSGIVYTPFENWQLYANVANGFRAPNIDDMGKVFESVPGYLVVPNPSLKPEKVINLELGTVKRFYNLLTVDASIYNTRLKDAMVRRDFELNGEQYIRFMGNKSRIQAIQNAAEIKVYGVQAGLEFFYQGFGLRSYISYQKGKEQSPDSMVFYPLRHAAPTFGSTHFTYEFRNKFKADFYVVYNAKMSYEELAVTERVNTSYARDEKGRAFVLGWKTFNFKMSYCPNPFVVLAAGVENITDLLYRPYASGINAPGRNFITSLRVKF